MRGRRTDEASLQLVPWGKEGQPFGGFSWEEKRSRGASPRKRVCENERRHAGKWWGLICGLAIILMAPSCAMPEARARVLLSSSRRIL